MRVDRSLLFSLMNFQSLVAHSFVKPIVEFADYFSLLEIIAHTINKGRWGAGGTATTCTKVPSHHSPNRIA